MLLLPAPAPRAPRSAAQAALRTLLRLLEWYLDPPPAHAARVPGALQESGALPAVLRLLLAHAARARLAPCWRWLLGACGRYPALLAYVAQARDGAATV